MSKKISSANMPFTAIKGQETFKLALILAAINPAIGGVLISGPRGSAKSTLARALADVMPVDHLREALSPNLVTLPLGASEEMLVGTLNLQKALEDQKVSFQDGLLAKADGGVLYVDEVNLLSDNLVDLLLDVAASGVNVVERDGISHSHAARFLLLGTMNPDEGQLRPQLQDRFGFAVELSNQYSVEERMDIVRLREAFDKSPNKFIAQYQQQQQQLVSTIQMAQQQLANITCSDSMRRLIAESCQRANVEGVRADIVWYRAALAHAAWRLAHGEHELEQSLMDEPAYRQEVVRQLELQKSQSNRCILEDDILAVEELVLSHRRRPSNRSANPPSGSSSGESTDNSPSASKPPFSRPMGSRLQDAQLKAPLRNQHDSHLSQQNKSELESDSSAGGDLQTSAKQPQGDWGSMEPQIQLSAPTKVNVPIDDNMLDHSSRVSSGLCSSILHNATGAKKVSPNVRGRRGNIEGNTIDWFASMLSSVAQGLSTFSLSTLRYRKLTMGQPVLHLILLDTSASTLPQGLLASAKATVLSIAQKAYVNRQEITIVGFGNDQTYTLLPQQRAPKTLHDWVDSITAAGGTPLRQALDRTLQLQKQRYARYPDGHVRTYVITDGRTTQSFDDKQLLGEVVVIDTEKSAIKRGKSKELAQVLNAQYFSLFA